MPIDEQLRHVLAQRPCGLMTDIDGTISPLVPTPDEAAVTPRARDLLRQLAHRIDLVAAISGRPATVAARMIGVPELTYIGNHGLELWQNDHAVALPVALPYVEAIQQVLRKAQTRIALRGVLFEDKGVTATVHYRQTNDPAAAKQLIGAVLLPLAEEYGVRLTRGQMIWEIRPPIEANKGTAVIDLIRQNQLRGAIFIGDDRTDADAFVALRRLRGHGDCVTLNIGVDAPDTPQIVRDEADLLARGVGGVEHVLSKLLEITA